MVSKLRRQIPNLYLQVVDGGVLIFEACTHLRHKRLCLRLQHCGIYRQRFQHLLKVGFLLLGLLKVLTLIRSRSSVISPSKIGVILPTCIVRVRVRIIVVLEVGVIVHIVHLLLLRLPIHAPRCCTILHKCIKDLALLLH